jgi:hypothetical protein
MNRQLPTSGIAPVTTDKPRFVCTKFLGPLPSFDGIELTFDTVTISLTIPCGEQLAAFLAHLYEFDET